MSSESRSPDFLAGYRNAARTAVAWLHKRAGEMGDPHAKIILDARAHEMGAAFKYGKIEDKASPSIQDREAVQRVYIDCEFNGWMGELISFAMVAEDGREFYSVLPEPRVWDAWCFENVRPVLGKPPVASYDDFRLAFLEFLRGFRNPIIVADWPADLYYFNSVLLGNSGHENSVLIPCRMELVSVDSTSAVPHNALEDARAIRSAIDAGATK